MQFYSDIAFLFSTYVYENCYLQTLLTYYFGTRYAYLYNRLFCIFENKYKWSHSQFRNGGHSKLFIQFTWNKKYHDELTILENEKFYSLM